MHEHSRLFPEVPGDDEIQPARTEGESSLWHHHDVDTEATATAASAEASLPHIDTGSLSTLFAAGGADHETSAAPEAEAPTVPPGVPRGYPRRRVARGKLIGVAVAAVVVAAIGVGAFLFMTKPAGDALGPLRDDERVVFALENDVISQLSKTDASPHATESTVTYVLAQGETLRGVVSDAALDNLKQAGSAVSGAISDLAALTPPQAYQRDLPKNPDAAAIATAREALAARKLELELTSTSIDTAQETLDMRMESFTLTVAQVTTELQRVSEAQLAAEPPLEDEEATATLTAVLGEFAIYDDASLAEADIFAAVGMWSNVGAATRVFIDERARLAAEEKARLEAEQEAEEETETDWYPPATDSGVTPPDTTSPGMNPPVTPPTTDPPTTNPPVTDPPTTDPPATTPPATDPPASDAT